MKKRGAEIQTGIQRENGGRKANNLASMFFFFYLTFFLFFCFYSLFFNMMPATTQFDQPFRPSERTLGCDSIHDFQVTQASHKPVNFGPIGREIVSFHSSYAKDESTSTFYFNFQIDMTLKRLVCANLLQYKCCTN